MKSQDVLLLLKLVCLQKSEKEISLGFNQAWPSDWKDWDDDLESMDGEYVHTLYTTRALEVATGISKSQVSLSINRCLDVGLLKYDRKTNVPRANKKALFEFIIYGLKYVFPAKAAEVTRGIATAFAAPVLNKTLIGGGEMVPVWPDARGNTKGQAVEPLFKSVVYAIRQDPQLYALLALVDAIRIGMPREASLAKELLRTHLEVD